MPSHHKFEPEGLEPEWKLPRGQHRLPREVVIRNQRLRLVAGVAQAMAEHGYIRLTVEHVIEVAGVSRATFYEHFENKQDAILIAHDVVFDRFNSFLVRACGEQSQWPRKVEAGISTAIAFAVAEPANAQLLVLDAIAADARVADRVLVSNDYLAGLLRAGREEIADGSELPDLTEKALVGAVSAIVAGRLMNGESERLPQLEPQLIELVLIPYLGKEGAARFVAGSDAGR